MDVRTALKPRRAPLAAASIVALALVLSAAASSPATAAQPPPKRPASYPAAPAGYTLGGREALAVAVRDPNVAMLTAERGRLTSALEAKPPDRWQVGFFAGGTEVVQVIVDAHTGAVRESWTGDQVAWQMARGYEGQFGHALNAPYVWIPLAAIFGLGLFDRRRPWRIGHLDLLVMLSFGLSQIFFNRGEIGISVPLTYPPLLYLLARMLWIGFRGAGSGLRPSARTSWLAIGAVFLIAFRVALNIADSGVIDVGYAGVIGADRIEHGQPVYGDAAFPENNRTGDTYGPANYYAYVPFEAALPWSGNWDDLPAAHAAAICFDLATVAGLFALGLRLRPGRRRDGRRLGVILGFAWLAYPYTDFALQSNSNDSLVAALIVWAFVVLASPVRRGALLALAGAAKFAPLVLAPLLGAGETGLAGGLRPGHRPRPGLRPLLHFAFGLSAITVLMLVNPALDPGLATFWERTLGSQLDRTSPFSVWGQIHGIEWAQRATLIAAAGLAMAVAFVPRRREPAQLAALAAAVLIALQLSLDHWFYLYLPWFAGLVFVALVAGTTRSSAAASREHPA